MDLLRAASEELVRLHGIDVHEMQLYRPVVDHVVEQIEASRTLIVEADSFYMPDGSPTSYRRAHVKSSIAIEAIDPAEERLRYFHRPATTNSAMIIAAFSVWGERFRTMCCRPIPSWSGSMRGRAWRAITFVARHIKCSRGNSNGSPRVIHGWRLETGWRGIFRRCSRAPTANITLTLSPRCGSAGPHLKRHRVLEWLTQGSSSDAQDAIDAFGRQVKGAKSLLFRLARRRAFDATPAIRELAHDWDIAMFALDGLATGVFSGVA